ncbi:HAD family hydrolase [Phycicoccus sp.]|uniref:HAD family hydrolase n=1 Tax=Phycicoccus sp. TaxID=1902410 RepID=UPI002B59ED7E|nr:HAD family hydrolase [Phycicoccus sp.]HMM96740.1 HAD family hydrolase [Phycicoccus sp.]
MSGPWDGLGVEAVLLDADDTLYDTRTAMHRAGAAAAQALWPDADPDRLARAGVRFRDDPEGHFAAYTRGETEFDEMRRARLDELAAWLDRRPEGDWWDAFEDAYEPAFLATLEAFEDVRPAVAALRATGLAVGVLTNSSGDYTRAKLAAARLEDLFDVVCSRDTLGFGKPDARAFHEASRRLGAPPARTLYVGDEVSTDPLGAADAGLPAAWLVRDGEPDERGLRLVEARKVPVVRSLAEIPDLLVGDAVRFGPGERAR